MSQQQLNQINMFGAAAAQGNMQSETLGRNVYGEIDGLNDVMIRRDPKHPRFSNADHALDFVIAAVKVFEELIQLGFDSPENEKERLDVAQRAVAQWVAMRIR